MLSFKLVHSKLNNMKKIKYILLATIIATIWGCKPEEFGPIVGSEENFLKEMQGTWSLTKVTQVDQNAVSNGWPYKQLDITNIYPYKELVVSFQGDASGKPSTFTITPGNSPKIADLNSGNWSVDNTKAPTVITLTNNGQTSTLTLGSYANLKNGKFYLKREKKVNGKTILVYQYEFTKK